MNRLTKWLKPGLGQTPVAEKKASAGGFVSIPGTSSAVWSLLAEGEGVRNGFCRNPVVHRCVSLVSEAAASVPFRITQGMVEQDEHPLLDLLARPNPRQSGTKVFERLYANLLISGNAYLVRIRMQDRLREIHGLDPLKITTETADDGWPDVYVYTSRNKRTRYRAAGEYPEILHLSLFNPLNEVEGLSPLSAAHMALDIHNAASEWNKALLDNSARPSGALVYAASNGENLTEEQFGRLKRELEEGYAGSVKAGRPMVLEGGLDWKSMGYSPRDMDFLQAKNGAAREIALAFGVPPMLLGVPGDNTYANYQEANRAVWCQTIMPLVEKVAADLCNWLGDEFGNALSVTAATDQVDALAGEREALWNRIGQAGFLTDDEKRQALGFAPLEVNVLNTDSGSYTQAAGELPETAWLYLAKLLGAIAGSAISIVYVLPMGKREAIARFFVSLGMGIIFGSAVGAALAGHLGIAGRISAFEVTLSGSTAASLCAWWGLGVLSRIAKKY